MRSSTRLATLDGWPSQIGVPMTRNIGRDDALAQRGPGVALALIGFDAGLDVLIDRADDLALCTVLCERVEQLPQQYVGGRRLAPAGTFQAAIESKDVQRRHRHGRLPDGLARKGRPQALRSLFIFFGGG